MTIKIIISLVIIAAGVFVFNQINDSGEVKTGLSVQTGTKIGDIAPDFQLVDYEGKVVALSDFKGQKGVFLNFWASWCPFCVEEMPLMAEVQERHPGQYETIAVNRGESLAAAREFSDKVGVTGRMTLLLDREDGLYQRYGGFAMPYSLFIDKDGVIRDVKLGPLTEEELERKVEKIISNK